MAKRFSLAYLAVLCAGTSSHQRLFALSEKQKQNTKNLTRTQDYLLQQKRLSWARDSSKLDSPDFLGLSPVLPPHTLCSSLIVIIVARPVLFYSFPFSPVQFLLLKLPFPLPNHPSFHHLLIHTVSLFPLAHLFYPSALDQVTSTPWSLRQHFAHPSHTNLISLFYKHYFQSLPY